MKNKAKRRVPLCYRCQKKGPDRFGVHYRCTPDGRYALALYKYEAHQAKVRALAFASRGAR